MSYSEALPPIRAWCEVMALIRLSRWYNNLTPMQIRSARAAAYGEDQKVLKSWLHHLSLGRNMCAQHSRLRNRDFTVAPKLPHSKPAGLAAQCRAGSYKLYNALVILLPCMDVIAPKHHSRARLKDLIARHAVPVAAMDFPTGWEQLAIWQENTP